MDVYILFLNVTSILNCPIVHIISISNVSIDVCGFFYHKSRNMSNSKLRVSIDMLFVFSTSFCMSNVINL